MRKKQRLNVLRASIAVSGLSANTPSTPALKYASYSAKALPCTEGAPGSRMFVGRKLFSLRKVYGCTFRPALCASGTSWVGAVRFPSAPRGITISLYGPMPAAYPEISLRPLGVTRSA